MGTLVVVEHDGSRLRAGSLSALAVARDLGPDDGPVEMLLLGHGLAAVTADCSRYGPVVVADSEALAHPVADRYARVIAEVCTARNVGTVVASSSTFAKDILPRASALMRGAMVSDVTGLVRADGEVLFQRPIQAGGAVATVRLLGRPHVVTIRASAFAPARPLDSPGAVTNWASDVVALPSRIEFVETASRATSRPDVAEARVVVSGGRVFRDAEEFERYVGALADALGGATGCTRALVDAGIAPNQWQVGQTGKVVAPDLYIALGISGAVQHLAGMKNSRVIVAVNRDEDAPIFRVAHYGLVGDVRQVVPQVIAELTKPG
jgi:electron transfer flavoprotein alpha subunit